MKYLIYTIKNPITNEIFYVGKTEQPLEKRLYAHLTEKSNPKNPRCGKSEILVSIVSQGLMPIIEKVDSIYGLKNALELEAFWIKELFSKGHQLTNREVSTRRSYTVYYTTNFPYGVAVKDGDSAPIRLLMYGKSGNRYDPEHVVEKTHPCYREVHEKEYYRELHQELILLKESVYPFLKKQITDKEAIESGLINEDGLLNSLN